MILKLVMEIIISIVATIMNVITGNIDGSASANMISDFITFILQFANTGFNFLYFCFGDTWQTIAAIALAITMYKYLLFPIIVIIRRVFIKGGDE